MRIIGLYIFLLILSACSDKESYVTIYNESGEVTETQIFCEGLIIDSILEFNKVESYFMEDTLIIEFNNNNGWQDRTLHLEIKDSEIQGWIGFADDISNHSTKIKNIVLNSGLLRYDVNSKLTGELDIIFKSTENIVTYKGVFTTEITELSDYEIKIRNIKPNREKKYN